jgi:hypothetical protein
MNEAASLPSPAHLPVCSLWGCAWRGYLLRRHERNALGALLAMLLTCAWLTAHRSRGHLGCRAIWPKGLLGTGAHSICLAGPMPPI